jgi:hypothetical protein
MTVNNSKGKGGMMQMQLLLRDQKKTATLETILAQPTMKDALKLSISVSGLTHQQCAQACDIDMAQWSRIFSNGAHFPESKLPLFMETVGNVIPLIWLNHRMGYTMSPLKNEYEMEIEKLQKQVAEKDKEIEILAKYKAKGII